MGEDKVKPLISKIVLYRGAREVEIPVEVLIKWLSTQKLLSKEKIEKLRKTTSRS